MNNQKNMVLSYRGFIYYCNILQMNMPYFQLIKAFLKIQQDCFKNFQILNQDQFLNPQLNKSLISRLHFTHLQNSQQQTQLPSLQYINPQIINQPQLQSSLPTPLNNKMKPAQQPPKQHSMKDTKVHQLMTQQHQYI